MAFAARHVSGLRRSVASTNARLRCAMLAAVVATAVVPAVAHGYVLEGTSWPTHTISYYDAGPNHAAVRAAVHAWNTSGANVRFVPTSRARARVIILPFSPRGCLGLEGVATVGYDPQGDLVHLRRCSDSWEAAIVAAHELGHVLGLGHETHVCATMNPSTDELCGSPPAYYGQCRILQADDVRGAVRRFGGHVRPIRSPQFCPEYSAPLPPLSVNVTGNAPPAEELTAAVRIPPEQALVTLPAIKIKFQGMTLKQTAPQQIASVYQYPNACPAGSPHGKPTYEQYVSGSGHAQVDLGPRAGLQPGVWCFAVWTTDSAGRRSPHATAMTVTVAHQGPSASFSPPQGAMAGYPAEFDDASSQGDDAITSWQWNFGDGSTSSGQYVTHTYEQAGTYTATLTVSAADGQTSSVSNQVDVADGGTG